MNIHNYHPNDYAAIKALYLDSALYGGEFDPARDAEDRLAAVTRATPDAILVAEDNGVIVGTVSLIDDGRVAWLFRFAARTPEAVQHLYKKACEILKNRGHQQVLVYSPVGDTTLDTRYQNLGMNKGSNYTCHWVDLE
jgi:hypothetical protein